MKMFTSQRNAKSFGALVLAGLSLVAGQALAADLGGSLKDEPVYAEPAPSFSWRGFYLGLNAGADWDGRSVHLSPADPAANIYFNGGAVPHHLSGGDQTRFIGGGQAGYNWQSGALVYGIEVDYSGIAGNGDSATVRTNALGFATFDSRGSSHVDQLATLRGRIGWTVAPRTLLYATGGLAVGQTHLSSSITTPFTPCNGAGLCVTGSSSDWRAGWTVGGGVEHAISRNWTIRAEYLHYDLGTTSFTANDPAFPAPVFQTKSRFEGDIVRAGVNFKF